MKAITLTQPFATLVTIGESITVPAKLFVDLVEAAGWVATMARGVDLANHPDPNAVIYLSGEADAVRAQAEEWLAQNWPAVQP